MDGQEMLGVVGVVTELAAKLHDHLVQRARRAVVIVTPDLVEQPVSGKHLAGMGVEELKQLEFAGGEFLGRFTAAQLEFLRIDRCGADLELALLGGGLAAAPRASEQGMNARDKFTYAERFGHVV